MEREIATLRADRDRLQGELDSARRLYCYGIATHGERIYGIGDRCNWNTPLKVAVTTWPTEVDRLFPHGEPIGWRPEERKT